jgi:NAD(P)-dependent dehydrogenase (short-subunit alcohol dehydrogenase family)
VRALIVGGGRRGLRLAEELTGEGHAVRVVTRTDARDPDILAVGAEPWRGDPDRVGTLRYALDNVTLLLWLLGTATGTPDAVAALHGPRLRMMLDKTTDTTVRGVVYEAAGRVPSEVLATGAEHVRAAGRTNEIPYALLHADPADQAAWLTDAHAAIARLLSAPPGAAARPWRTLD